MKSKEPNIEHIMTNKETNRIKLEKISKLLLSLSEKQ